MEENNLEIKEVIEIIKNIKYEKIEIYKDPFYAIENLDFMDKYELTDEDVKDIIKSVEIDDLYEGPVIDYNNEKFKYPCWVFLKYIKTLKVKVYIKIKIVNHNRKVLVYKIH